MEKPRHTTWFHPLLFSIYPALSLLAANIDQVRLSQGFRIIAVSLLLGILTYLGAMLVFRGRDSAAPLASMALVCLLSYGRLYDGLKAVGLSGETVIRHRYLIPACAVLFGVGAVWCERSREKAALNRALNAVSIIALVFPLAGLGLHQFSALKSIGPTDVACTLRPPDGQPLPDVYIIIMDAYERDDVLREFHGYDNSPFLQSLEDMGFYVGYGSLSNYRHTELSLSSLLNMAYIQDFPELFGTRPNHQMDIVRLINHSRVRQELECLGYVTVAFETGHFWTEWDDADYYLRRDPGEFLDGVGGKISRLEQLFLKTTATRIVLDKWIASQLGSPPAALDPLVDYRDRILFVLDELAGVAALPTPKLVFVHVLSPHPPFVLGPNGEPINEADFETIFSGHPEDYPVLELYEGQVTYLNKRLLRAVGAILDESDVLPIIVLMGDHGWADRNMEDKLSILNSYLVPPEAAARLDQTISPVNSFRVIFDAVFGGSYGKLADVSYFSLETDEYNFTVIPNTWTMGSP